MCDLPTPAHDDLSSSPFWFLRDQPSRTAHRRARHDSNGAEITKVARLAVPGPKHAAPNRAGTDIPGVVNGRRAAPERATESAFKVPPI
jgi:hypothetical protein